MTDNSSSSLSSHQVMNTAFLTIFVSYSGRQILYHGATWLYLVPLETGGKNEMEIEFSTTTFRCFPKVTLPDNPMHTRHRK